MGDFSQLKALGVNTAAAEADYALAQKTATAQYNKQYGTGISGSSTSVKSTGTRGSGGGTATTIAKTPKTTTPTASKPVEPKVYSVIDDALGNFETSNGLAVAAKYLVQNGVFTRDEYNSWAKARGKIKI